MRSYTACTRWVRSEKAHEPAAGQRERLRVAVQADERQPRVGGEQGGGVAAEPQRGVDEDGRPVAERGVEELGDTGQEDGDVPGPSRPARRIRVGVLPHRSPPAPRLPVRSAPDFVRSRHVP